MLHEFHFCLPQKKKKRKYKTKLCLSCAHLPALDVGLQLFQSLQFLHLPLGLVDVGADSLHGLQSLLHCRVVSVLLWSPFQQFLWKVEAEVDLSSE